MPFFLTLLLGIVQGFAEFLPISTPGHLALLQKLFDMDKYIGNHALLDVAIHLGALVSVVMFFWLDIKKLVVSAFGLVFSGFKLNGDAGRKLVLMLIVASLPLASAYLARDFISNIFEKPLYIGIALLFTALLLYFGDNIAAGAKTSKSASVKDTILVGLTQAVSVIPGISRYGCTITVGIFRGFSRDFAVKFAFLISIPTMFAAVASKLPDALAVASTSGDIFTFAVGLVSSAVGGYFSIRLVRYALKEKAFKYFAYYCAIIGALAIFGALTNLI